MNFSELINSSLFTAAKVHLITYLPKVVMAILLLIVGFWLCGKITKLITKILSKRSIVPAVSGFLSSVVGALLKVVVVVSAAQMLGVATTSFVAVLGAMGLAVGLALQGSLANFSGGVLILIFKPFKTGDYIEASGVEGFVTSIQIFQTTLLTHDNRKVIIPNGPLSNGNITNYTAEDTRRVDWTFGIGYEDDINKAEETIKKVLTSSSFYLNDPAPLVAVSEHADSSINFTVRAWTKTENYWDFYFEVPKKVKEAFDQEKISIPYPQMDIHMKQPT